MSIPRILSEIIHARDVTNRAIKELKQSVMNDSSTYSEALEKLKEFKWQTLHPVSAFIVQEVMDSIKREALESSIKNAAD